MSTVPRTTRRPKATVKSLSAKMLSLIPGATATFRRATEELRALANVQLDLAILLGGTENGEYRKLVKSLYAEAIPGTDTETDELRQSVQSSVRNHVAKLKIERKITGPTKTQDAIDKAFRTKVLNVIAPKPEGGKDADRAIDPKAMAIVRQHIASDSVLLSRDLRNVALAMSKVPVNGDQRGEVVSNVRKTIDLLTTMLTPAAASKKSA
jgi:hypothetical protein